MLFRLITGLLITFNTYAQISISQSTPELNWKQAENDFVRIIYPDYIEDKAQYILNLIEYNSSLVGQTMGINNPQKFDLIIRAEISELNGFVTLGPRRSEWYSNANLVPHIGALEWYQSLAIHEYRHVNHFDYSLNSNNRFFYFILGELGQGLALYLTVDSWYLEGDAVWAETKYTDAGRGRSPRFAARLRALLTSDLAPYSYDDFLINNYDVPLPNHYVYGYFTVNGLREKYQENTPDQIFRSTMDYLPHPWRFYNAFKNKTGIKFEQFFDQTMLELKDKWSKDTKSVKFKKFESTYYPQISDNKNYYLKKDLDNLLALYENDTKLRELNVNSVTSKISIADNKMVYTQQIPHHRYAFKSYNDLFIYHIQKDEIERLTYGKRYHHPSFSKDGKKIVAVHFDDKNEWKLHLLATDGKLLEEIIFPNELISEAVFIDDTTIAYIGQIQNGLKAINTYDLKTKISKKLIDYTRANIFGLNTHQQFVYFDGDANGRVEIFRVDGENLKLELCSKANIAQYTPAANDKKLLSIEESVNGTTLKEQELECTNYNQKHFENFNYLSSDSPSDHSMSAPEKLLEIDTSKVYPSQDYQHSQDLTNFHSWSFFGNGGFLLSANSNNLLNDFSLYAGIGTSKANRKDSAEILLSYMKYYPIFNFGLSSSKRDEEISTNNFQENKESSASFEINLPYIWQNNFWSNALTFKAGAEYIALNKVYYSSYNIDDSPIHSTYAGLEVSLMKQRNFRDIIPEYGVNIASSYHNNESTKLDQFSNYYYNHWLQIYLPGFGENHGFKLSTNFYKQNNNNQSYRYDIEAANELIDYIYARGYAYRFNSEIEKYSLNYLFPISNKYWGYKDYFHFNRITAGLFYDYSTGRTNNQENLYRSAGAELNFESLTFRKLPITYTLRVFDKIDPDGNELPELATEFFIGINLL